LYDYQESRRIGYEAAATDNEDRQKEIEKAKKDGRSTADIFDAAVKSSSKGFYVTFVQVLDAATEQATELEKLCDQKFGDVSPSLAGLRKSIQEIRTVANSFLQRKRDLEPDEKDSRDEEPVPLKPEPRETPGAPAPSPREPQAGAEPADIAEAISRICWATDFIRRLDPASAIPYRVVRALRFAELDSGDALDSSRLEAPEKQVRIKIRAAVNDSNWEDVLKVTESSLQSRAGSAWLDLHRHAATACEQLGYSTAAGAIRAEVRALTADHPELATAEQDDGFPTANADTRTWLQSLSPASGNSPMDELPQIRKDAEAPDNPVEPDIYELAKQAVAHRNLEDAVEMLMQDAGQQPSGRMRFQRRVQLAQICMGAGYHAVAYPILQGLHAEIENRNLAEWESPEVVGLTLSLLYRCLDKIGNGGQEKAEVYGKLCRINPVAALEFVT
jgi:type VI secretion system protein ImpA